VCYAEIVKRATAKQNDALVRFLGPKWLPLWEEYRGKWRLVFLSAQLIQRYRDATKMPLRFQRS
jgi:hypothetical protein